MLAATNVVINKDEGWRCEVHLLALFALELLTIASDATLVWSILRKNSTPIYLFFFALLAIRLVNL